MIRPTKTARSGFTLIELLVVIAIIAILAAILFPVFAKAREKARTSSCASNCKQIALAMTQYAQDYDERYGYTGGGARIDNSPWIYNPYVKNTQVFKCPSMTQTNVGSAYLLNNNISYKALAALQEPAALVVGMDGYIGGGGNRDPNATLGGVAHYGLADDYTIWQEDTRICGGGNGLPRHTEKANIWFADGHVKISPNLPTSTANLPAELNGVMPYGQWISVGVTSPAYTGPWQ